MFYIMQRDEGLPVNEIIFCIVMQTVPVLTTIGIILFESIPTLIDREPLDGNEAFHPLLPILVLFSYTGVLAALIGYSRSVAICPKFKKLKLEEYSPQNKILSKYVYSNALYIFNLIMQRIVFIYYS